MSYNYSVYVFRRALYIIEIKEEKEEKTFFLKNFTTETLILLNVFFQPLSRNYMETPQKKKYW